MSKNRRRRFKLTHMQFHYHKDFRRQGGRNNFLNSCKYSRINPLYRGNHSNAKFMKDILSKKKKIAEEGIVSLTTTCSAVIQNSLLANMKDPGIFTIPCSIRKYEFKEALCDSGASINYALIIGTKAKFGGTYFNSNHTTDG